MFAKTKTWRRLTSLMLALALLLTLAPASVFADGGADQGERTAYFYLQVAGTGTWIYCGTGTVIARIPTASNETVSAGSHAYRQPDSLPDITVDGVTYRYNAGATPVAGTYQVTWKDLKDCSGANNDDGSAIILDPAWHIDGVATLTAPVQAGGPLPEALKPQVSAEPAVYDGQAHGLTITYPADTTAEDYSVTFSTDGGTTINDNYARVNAGETTVTVTFDYHPAGQADPNFDPYTTSATIVVDPRPVTIQGETATVPYDEQPHTIEAYTVTGLVDGHSLTFGVYGDPHTNRTPKATGTAAGSYTQTITEEHILVTDKNGTPVDNKNYSFTCINGLLTITEAPTATHPDYVDAPTASSVTATYDGKAHKLQLSEDALKNFKVEYQVAGGDWTELAPSVTDVGSLSDINVRFTYRKASSDTTNYLPILVEDLRIVVTPRTLTLKVDDLSKTVGEAAPDFTCTASGLLDGHQVVMEDLKYNWDDQDAAGSHTVSLDHTSVDILDANGNSVKGNYSISPVAGTLTISAAPETEKPETEEPETEKPETEKPETEATPAAPTAPVTPAAPVAEVAVIDHGGDAATAAAAVEAEVTEEAEEVEEVEEDATPLAQPEEEAPAEEPETIEDDATAQAGVEGGWALINLILMAVTMLAGLAMLGLRFAGKTGTLHLFGVAPALISLLAFLLTEDMGLPMVLTDRWTLLMAAIALAQLVLMLLGRRSDDRTAQA